MNVSYTIREAFSGFRRTKLASLGSILTICVALLLLGLYSIISLNASRLVQLIRDKVEIEVFCEEPLNRPRMADLQQQLLAVKGVERVQFVSKEEAAKIFKQEFGEDISSVLDFNPLPPSFKVFLKDESKHSAKVNEIVKQIKTLKGIDDVIYRKDLLELLDRRAAIANAVGLTLGIVIGVSAIFLVSNTIRLTIYAKRKMIQTMKLVGATRWFIRAPFLLEGILQGLIGGMLAAALIYFLLEFLSRWISPELAESMSFGFAGDGELIHIGTVAYGFMVLCGMMLGLFGSFISIRRFIGESVVN